MRFDAAIVGGGAAGSILAWKLAEKGWKVVVLEKKKEAGGKVCGGLVSHRVIRFSGTEAIMNEIRGARVFFPGGREVTIGGERVYAYVIDRDAVDREMVEKAVAAGAVYHTGFRVERIADRKIKGKEEIEFDYLIGADGASSMVASLHNMGEIEYINAIQGHSKDGNKEEYVSVYFDNTISPGFFSWVIPDGEKARIGLGSVERNVRKKLNMLEKKIGREVREARGAIIPAGLRKLYVGNVALIGDAAGQVKATSGGGLYAICVAASSLADSFPDFSDYKKRFMKEFGGEIKRTLMARKIFLKLKNEDMDRIAEHVEREAKMISRYGDIDYQSEVAKRFFMKHPLATLMILMKRFFI